MKRLIITALGAAILMSCNNTPDYDATGIFEATTVTVSAETSGRIVDLSLNEGDTVSLGDCIAIVDTTLLALQEAQLAAQQASVESSSPDIAAQASSLRTQIDHWRSECERYDRLLAAGATTQKTVDDAHAQLNSLEGQLQALLSTLTKNQSSTSGNSLAIQYQRDQIAEQIARSYIHAPVGGTIIDKYAEQGEYAAPGRAICSIADLDNIYLRCYFTADQLADIAVGQQVTVIADFGGDKQYEYAGTITWIAQNSEFTPKSIQTNDSRANLVYACKVSVKNDGRLKLGQYGEVRL
ncbi:MAG: HlyD family secretion protein [Muribaculaceae bacterium]